MHSKFMKSQKSGWGVRELVCVAERQRQVQGSEWAQVCLSLVTALPLIKSVQFYCCICCAGWGAGWAGARGA